MSVRLFVCVGLKSGILQPMSAQHELLCGRLRGGVWHDMWRERGTRRMQSQTMVTFITVLSFSTSLCVSLCVYVCEGETEWGVDREKDEDMACLYNKRCWLNLASFLPFIFLTIFIQCLNFYTLIHSHFSLFSPSYLLNSHP